MSDAPLLQPEHTCWRRAAAHRVAFLVDGADYFAALASAIERAERSVLMIGWDFHSRVRLRREGDDEIEQGGRLESRPTRSERNASAGRSPSASDQRARGPAELAALLDAAARRPGRRVHVLAWDFAMIYALEREALPLLRFGLFTHRRVHFRLDGEHPVGASHHQKIAVIDDRLAFCGGIDVTAARWDTPEHRAGDPRRNDPGFRDYPPFHDVQMAVDGEAAAALGELARQRWQRATGRRLPRRPGAGDPWPPTLAPDLEDVEVGIARTDPAHDGRSEVREVQALYLEAIRAARRSIYIENQYLTAGPIGEALAERLGEAEGPDVVIVGPLRCSGWLEEGAMGVGRARLLRRLRQADRHRRLHVYHPVVPDVDPAELNVHAKVLVVDDRLLRIGSANLSNRSMGLDTECDLALEARGELRVMAGIAGFRNRLLAEHLGVAPAAVAEAEASLGRLGAAVEKLRGGPRSLEPLEGEVPEWLDRLVPQTRWLDPERPVDPAELAKRWVPEELTEPRQLSRLARVGLSLAGLFALALIWRVTPLGEHVTPERLAALAAPFRSGASGVLLGTAVFSVLGLLVVPVTVLIVGSALVYGGPVGFAVAFAGALLSAGAGYALGALLWRDAVRRLAGRRLNRLSRRLARSGVLSVAALRLLPLAPFTVVNLVAGASRIHLRDFLLGTALGMAPGMLALCLLSSTARRAVTTPEAISLVTLAGVAIVTVVGAVLLRRRLGGDADP